MISGYRCYQAMTELEQRRWQRNTNREPNNSVGYMIGRGWDSFYDFISTSFIWSHTKEGSDYWNEVSKKYILHDTLSPPKSFSRNEPPKPFT